MDRGVIMRIGDLFIHAWTVVIYYILASWICDTYIIQENLIWMITGMGAITSGNLINIICKAWRTPL